MSDRLQRARTVRIYDVEDRMVVLGRDGTGHELVGDSAQLGRAVLAFFGQPRPRAELLPHIEELAGGPVENSEVLDELVRLFLDAGVLEPSTGPRPASQSARHRPCRVVLGITGAVGSMHTPALVQALQGHGFSVRVAATANALRFVQPEGLQALTHRPVVTSLWPDDVALPVPHINLAQWADAVVVCPASATTVSRLASADHDCVVAATALATAAPVLVVPSMNPAMYNAPGVQRNLEQLVADGFHVAHPGMGLEVADAPEHRGPLLGAAPPPAIVVQLLRAVVRRRGNPTTPIDGDDWDALYRQAGDPPWQSAVVDADLEQVLEQVPSPAAVLDIGTGLGSDAVALAELGHRVVATDVSAVALRRAQEAAPKAGVVWLEDDITATGLHATFDVVIDRGCLHLLTKTGAQAYAEAVARLTAPGGTLVLKTLASEVAAGRGATAYDRDAIAALLGDAFTLEHHASSTIPGPADAPAAGPVRAAAGAGWSVSSRSRCSSSPSRSAAGRTTTGRGRPTRRARRPPGGRPGLSPCAASIRRKARAKAMRCAGGSRSKRRTAATATSTARGSTRSRSARCSTSASGRNPPANTSRYDSDAAARSGRTGVRLGAVLRGVGYGLATLILASCQTEVFACGDDKECTGADGGRCEANGYCSFPDAACPSGRRYGDLSGPFSGKCVVDEDGTGSTSSPPMTPLPPGTTEEPTTLPVDDSTGSSTGVPTTGEPTSTGSSTSSTTGPATDPDLVLWIDFEDAEMGDFPDRSGYGNDASCPATCPVSTPGPAGLAGDFGEVGWLQVEHSESLSFEDELTVAAWILWDGTAFFGGIHVVGHPQPKGITNAYELYGYDDDKIEPIFLFTQVNGVGDDQNAVTDMPEPGTWVHTAGTWDGDAMTLYIDGDPVAVVPAPDLVPSSEPIYIGADRDAGVVENFWPGAIDEVRIYSRALDDSEIAELIAVAEKSA